MCWSIACAPAGLSLPISAAAASGYAHTRQNGSSISPATASALSDWPFAAKAVTIWYRATA